MDATVPPAPAGSGSLSNDYAELFAAVEPRLRAALVARLGPERGREAAAEALAWAFEHWGRMAEVTSPVAYLYRVGVSRTRPRKVPRLRAQVWRDPEVDPDLNRALATLSPRQREAVVLVCAYGWTLREVAELRDTTVSSVRTHVERGLRRLRGQLEVDDG